MDYTYSKSVIEIMLRFFNLLEVSKAMSQLFSKIFEKINVDKGGSDNKCQIVTIEFRMSRCNMHMFGYWFREFLFSE